MKQAVKSFALKFDESGHPELSLLLEKKQIDKLKLNLLELRKLQDKGKTIEVQLEELKQKRSLDANAYVWVLLDKQAAKLNTTKEELYKRKIREVGVFDYILIREEGIEKFISSWGMNGIGWFAEEFDGSKIEGCKRIRCYYGSSIYDTKQMTRLIDAVVQDCAELGIETKTPAEIAHLIELIENKGVKKNGS